jgi:hypothetical protein
MNPAAIVTIPLVTLALLGTGGAGGYAIRDRQRPGTCPGCGHPLGCRSPFGECTRKIRVRNYVSGRRAGWKREPCGCRDHAEPVVASPLDELLTAEVPQP